MKKDTAMPDFSIITINYNDKVGLNKTIKSIVNQTYFKSCEFIVIDGGSTDGSAEVIKEYASQIDYWVSEPDNGIYHAMNKGISQSHGEYLIFMNSGDEFYGNDILEKVNKLSGADILSGFTYIGTEKLWGPRSSNIGMVDFINGSLGHQASFIKRELFKERLYDESLKIVADWKFFVDVLIGKNCSFGKLDFVVSQIDPNGVSSIPENVRFERQKVLKEILPPRVYQDYMKMAFIFPPLLDILPQMTHMPWKYRTLLYKINKIFLDVYFFFAKKPN